jgi:hypothetical protein
MATPYTGSLQLPVIHGLVTVKFTRSRNGIRFVVTSYEYISLPTQQWLLLAPDRPCDQHVQSTRRMSLTVKRLSTKGLTGLTVNPWQLEVAITTGMSRLFSL